MKRSLTITFLKYLIISIVFLLYYLINNLVGYWNEYRYIPEISGFNTYIFVNLIVFLITIFITVKSIVTNKARVIQYIYLATLIPVIFFIFFLYPIFSLDIIKVTKTFDCSGQKLYFTGGINGGGSIYKATNNFFVIQNIGSIYNDSINKNFANPIFKDGNTTQMIKDCVNKEVRTN